MSLPASAEHISETSSFREGPDMADNQSVLLRRVRALLDTHPAAPDEQLLDRFVAERDEEAFAALVRRHGALVHAACRRVLDHEEDVDDVFQATFLVLARQARSVRRRDAVGAWLYGVARRLALRARVAAARRRRHESQAPPLPEAVSADDITWRDLRRVLDEELSRLPEKYQAPLVLCYLEGRTQDEAAHALGWKKRTLKARLAEGRRRLRKQLARRGLSLSAALAGPLLCARPAAARVSEVTATTTARAALLYASGRAAGTIPARVLTLAERGLSTMFLAKVQATLAVVVTTFFLGGLAILLAQRPADSPRPPAAEKAQVDQAGDPLPAGAVLRLGTGRFRHSGGSKELAFSPDGKTLLTQSKNTLLRFWETATGRLLAAVETDDYLFDGFALSGDGRRFASAGTLKDEDGFQSRGIVRLWDTATRKEIRTIRLGEKDRPSLVAFTPDGKAVVVAVDATVRIWDTGSGEELRQYPIGKREFCALAVSPDGNWVAVAETVGPVYLWEWRAKGEVRTLRVGDLYALALAFSPDSKTLAGGSYDRLGIRLWDVASGRLLRTLSGPENTTYPEGLAFSPDGKTLASTDAGNTTGKNRSGSVLLWSTSTGKLLRELPTPGESPSKVAFSKDGRWLATTTDGGARVWDLRSGKEVENSESHRGHVHRIAVSASGLVATASDDHTARLWDLTTGKHLFKLKHRHWVRGIALSPDGKRLVTSSLDDTQVVWDTATGKPIFKLPGHGAGGGNRMLGFTPDGKRFFSFGEDYYLRLTELRTGKAVREHPICPQGILVPDEDADDLVKRNSFMLLFSQAAVSPDGRTLVLSVGNDFRVFDAADGKERLKVPGAGSHVQALAISPDSKYLLASAWGKQVETVVGGQSRSSSAKEPPLCVWLLATGKLVHRINLPDFGAGPVAFSPDGRYFAAGIRGPKPSIAVYEMASGKPVRTFDRPGGVPQALAFSPDGRRLLSALDDTTVLVWDLKPAPAAKP
ncbi:MAG: sigma-70 family RNA polymerase sigma factor [Planctomycetes bacterium]|nr:sigma-70 family RNA polymerase sigma factor [Planctomycetota bacterium]